MIKIDLITGFLGSGKTSFIKKYAKYWMDAGYKIGIVENDFGAVNIDAMLLQDILGENCGLEMVAGACDADCHKRRFKTKLIAMGMSGYDRVLVEPSGIYDVDEFFDTLHEEPLESWYEIGNVIAIVDANLNTKMSKEAQYLLACQIANAGQIILSKTETASEDEIENTLTYLSEVMEKFRCRKHSKKKIVSKSWDEFEKEDFDAMADGGYIVEDYAKLWFDERKAFSSLYFMNIQMEEEKLYSALKMLMSDKECGNIFRVKGFMKTEERAKWLEFNATKKNISMKPAVNGQEVFIVIGEDLNEEKIQSYFTVEER